MQAARGSGSRGATGERLKEASGINVSLTVLGQVIMSLVDVQHGRRQHVPYRNSRLTFLLQVPLAMTPRLGCCCALVCGS